MNATFEVSLYALHNEYEQSVIDYILELKKQSFQIEVHGLSTMIYGDYDEVMKSLTILNKKIFQKYKSVIHIKIAEGDRNDENLPTILKF